MSHIRFFPISRFLVLGAVLTVGLVARADIDLPSVPPPQPEGATARVYRGESVEIPLRGLSRSGQPIEFVVRRAPTRGTLSAISRTGRTTAVVTYTARPGAEPGVDRFRYAVRAPGAGVSTPAEVMVEVLERPARFVAPARLEFPETAVGESVTLTATVKNAGGGRLAGEITVPPPWRLVGGKSTYALGPGDERTVEIAFNPGEARRFSGQIAFSHAESAIIGVEGVGYAPLEVVPRELRLEGDGRSEQRRGELVVRNSSEVERSLDVTWPKGVEGPARVTVGPRAEERVAVGTRPGFLGGIRDKVVLAGVGGLRLAVPVMAPARIVVGPERIDFGTLLAGKSGRAKFSVRNLGGSSALLRWSGPEGVTVQPDPSYEPLPPGGEAREYEVAFARPVAGELDAPLRIQIDSGAADIALRARVKTDPRTVSPGAGVGGAPVAATPAPQLNDLPAVEEIGVSRQDYREVDLTWKHVGPNAARYAVLLRRVVFNAAGEPMFRYEILPQVKPRVVRDEVRATLGGFRAGEAVTILIVAYDAAGTPSRMSPPFVITSKPKPPFRVPWTLLGIAAMAGFAGLWWWERRRQRRALEGA